MRAVFLLAAFASLAPSQILIDSRIAGEIAKIKAIDNHAHPVLPAPGDTGYDALPVEHMDPYTEPVRMRAPSPLAAEASRQMFAQPHPKDNSYPAWILDQLGIETMLANRIALGPGILPPRFRWVPFEDALLFPLDNSGLAAVNSDRKAFFEDEDRLLNQYLKECGLSKPPATLAEYLVKVVNPTLERHKRGGAIAVKFEAAYLRSLDFQDVPQAVAESVFNDPRLRKTSFVMLHGGWPFTREITALLTKPNVYTDFSAQTLTNYPRAVSRVLREWLEFAPDKILFATDAYPYSEELGWEQSGWIASRTGREALGLALTEMLNDREISLDRALELAHLVLHDNAAKLYNLR